MRYTPPPALPLRIAVLCLIVPPVVIGTFILYLLTDGMDFLVSVITYPFRGKH